MVVPTGDAVSDVVLQAFALLRVPQPGQKLRAPAFVRPGRNDAGEIVIAAGVRINIRLHIHPAPSRVFNQRHDLLHAAPIFLVRDLQMQDVHRHTRAFADPDRFLHRVEHAESLVAHVGGINAAVFAHDLA